MRLDRFFTTTGSSSRSEASSYIRKGRVSVNGIVVTDPSIHIDPSGDVVCFDGKAIVYSKYIYIMMNKPSGVVSSTEDGDVTVLDLLPDNLKKVGLFPCGRLDKDTLGFVLLTNNGKLSHFLLSPKSHVEKTYLFTVKDNLSGSDVCARENGVDIGGYITGRCSVKMISPNSGFITLSEGKYHQIKLMMRSVGSAITDLKRVSFAGIPLDADLKEGGWRYLSKEEIELLESHYR